MKIITAVELGEVVSKLIEDKNIDENVRQELTENLAFLVAGITNTNVRCVSPPDDVFPHLSVSFSATSETAKDGGVFKDFDTDETVEDWLDGIVFEEGK